MSKTALTIIDQARSWIGCKESDGSHHKIIDTYNSHQPLARGYKVTYTDSWCATFVSACAIKCKMTDIMQIECSCPKMIALYKAKGQYTKGHKTTPKAGDILFYDWQADGTSDHVGIVEQVAGGKIVVIEGNKNDSVARRVIDVGCKDICGFARPKYEEPKKETTKVAEKKAYTGTFPNLKVTVNDNSEAIDDMITWCAKYAADDRYKYKKWTSDPKTHQCPICHPGSGNGWNCIGFVSAAFHHGANFSALKCSCNSLLTNDFAHYDKITEARFRERNGKCWDLVYKKRKKCPVSKLKKGDVLICYDGKTYKHVAIYAGDGYVYDATSAYGIAKRKYSKVNAKVVFRYTGQKVERKKNKTISKGDSRKAQIKCLENFLVWAGCLEKKDVDGVYGAKTVAAVKKFQKKLGLPQTGKFGTKTLAAAKSYKK